MSFVCFNCSRKFKNEENCRRHFFCGKNFSSPPWRLKQLGEFYDSIHVESVIGVYAKYSVPFESSSPKAEGALSLKQPTVETSKQARPEGSRLPCTIV